MNKKHFFFFLKVINLIFIFFYFSSFLFAQEEVIKTFNLPCDTILHATVFPNIIEYRIKEPKIALALSGGGAKGFAHIGVLKQFEKHNIPIHAIYGTSIGAVVGGLYSMGYRPDDLIDNLKSIDIGSLFSLSSDVKREYLYQDQKISFSKSFITLRFKNFIPVLPSFLTSGQELSNQINKLVLQGLYHTDNFEELPIKFYVVCTDLVTGRLVILSNGNLSEAIRGSLTWPLLNPPVTLDDYKLIDGGILANIPAQFPKKDGYDIVIAINVTSTMKPMEDINNAGDVFNRLLSIMQLEFDERELSVADIVITPDLQKYTATSFGDVDTLVALGEESVLKNIDVIKELRDKVETSYNATNGISLNGIPFFVNDVQFEVTSEGEYISTLNERIIDEENIVIEKKIVNEKKIIDEQKDKDVYEREIIETLKSIKRLGYFKDIYCEMTKNLSGYRLTYKIEIYPFINSIHYSGNTVLPEVWLDSLFSSFQNRPFNHDKWAKVLETLHREYRKRNLSLAKIHTVTFDSSNNSLHVQISEGKINRVSVIGNENTRDFVISREFPLRIGDLFNIELATRGLSNIFSTDLFETVALEVDYMNEEPDIFVKVAEKPSELIRIGLRSDNERSTQMYFDFRNDNFLQSSGELGLILQPGFKDLLISIDYRMNKILKSPFFTKIQLKYQYENQYQYEDIETNRISTWDNIKTGEFKELKYGGAFTFGTLYKKLGHIFGEYKLEHQEIIALGDTVTSVGDEIVSSLKVGLFFDSQNEYPFPKRGSRLNTYYEFSSSILYTGVSFTKLFFSYETYIPFSKMSVMHPKVVFGFGDNSLPYTEQFKLGGQNSFFGLRENSYRGRQVFVGSLEYRHQFPISFLFDLYLSFRYDIGSVWEETTTIKFASLKHGIGGSIFFDTPIGPVGFSVGHSFKLIRDIPDNPISFGPLYTYFSLGFTLD